MAVPERTDDGPLAGDGADKLLAHLRATLNQPGLSFAQPPRRLTGGNESYIYDLRLSGGSADLSGPLILRAYRQGYARPDQARFEATVQNTIANLGYPAPRVFVVEPEPAALGTPFIVMERMPGKMMLEGIGELDEAGKMHFDRGRSLLSGIGLMRRIPQTCAEGHLRLHALDSQPFLAAIERAGLPLAFVSLDGRVQTLRDTIEQANLAGLRPALEWFVNNTPEPERLAICHSDMQPANILVTGRAITGVVDWSQVIIADPDLDVGYTKMALETAPLEMPRFLNWIGRPTSAFASRDYMRAYAKGRKVRPQAVACYGILRTLIALAGIGARRVGGKSEPDVWDNPPGVRNLAGRIRSVTGVEVHLPEDTRAGRTSTD